MTQIQKHVALIIGAGDDTGSAIARAFAKDGLHVCIVRRPVRLEKLEALAASIEAQGGSASAHGVDARDEEAMAKLITDIETNIGPIEVAIFNIGANVKFNIADTTGHITVISNLLVKQIKETHSNEKLPELLRLENNFRLSLLPGIRLRVETIYSGMTDETTTRPLT